MDANEQDLNVDNEQNQSMGTSSEASNAESMESVGRQGGSQSAADIAYEKAKEKVSKGVATAAGAVDGFTERMEKHDVGGSTKQALEKVGQTTREVTGTAAKQVTQTREHIQTKAKEGTQEGSSTDTFE